MDSKAPSSPSCSMIVRRLGIHGQITNENSEIDTVWNVRQRKQL